MKKVFPFILVIVLFSCQNTDKKTGNKTSTSKNTSVFNGVYSGSTPCADCPGIRLQVTFSPDSMYYETSEYLERATKISDTGRWRKSDSILTVDFAGRDPHQIFFKIVNDTTIQMLDGTGNPITGPLAEKYLLKKSGSSGN